VEALLRDLDFELAQPEPRRLASVFFGGGTPSLFSPQAVARVLEHAARRPGLAADAEVTLEANPGTADATHFRGYRSAGVNRLSIGVQSFDAGQLRRLGRIHGPDEARRAYQLARAAGFDNVNLDLMYALPEQSAAQARADLEAAVALGPEHLSYYQLTLEPNTEFHAHPPPLPDDDAAWAMHEQGLELLARHGYAQYEVSAHARDGRRCRHNLNYWEFGDYLGIGAGAHGKRTHAGPPGQAPVIERRARHKHPRTYVEGAGSAAAVQERRTVPAADLPFEFAMNALRLNHGFRLAAFEQRTGQPATRLEPALEQAAARGWLEREPGAVRPSARGRALLNPLTGLFLP
jgi:putative oxygen-independent coproporphyrinogen III oxidase